MLQRLLIITLTLCSLSASAQWQQTGSKVRYVNGLGIPTKDTAAGVSADSSQIVIRPADSSLYVKYKRTWLRVGGGGGSIAGSGTINRVAKFTSSSAIGNSLIYDNGTAVGINTLTPTTTLQVGNGTGNPEITASGLNYDVVLGTPSGSALGFTTVGNYVGVYSNSATKDLAFTHGNSRAITFGTGNQSRLTITASGRLLANTRTDNGVDALQVAGSMNVSTLATTNSLSVTNNATVGGTLDVTGTSNLLSRVNINTTVSGGGVFLTVNGGIESTSGGIGAAFRSKSNSPGNSNEFIANNTSAPFGYIGNFSGLIAGGSPYDTRDTIFAFRGRTDLTLATGGAFERVRLTRGGQLNIGGSFTSTNNTLQVTGNAAIGYTAAAPANGLLVAGNVRIGTTNFILGTNETFSAYNNNASFAVSGQSTTSTVAPFGVFNSATTGDNQFVAFYEGATNLRGSIDFNRTGLLTRYNTTSDARLKKNIRPTSINALDKLMKVEVKDYEWKENNYTATSMIAQELYKIFPDAVKKGDEGVEVKEQWQVSNSTLVPILIKAIQEQQSKIESLEKRLAAIEAILKSNKIQ